MGKIVSSETVADRQGRQYHLACKPGDLAEKIILVGEPQRAERGARLLDKICFTAENREFRIYTGRLKGVEISIIGTGIGPDNTEIAVVEAAQCTRHPTFIRCGSCGALQPEITPGDLIVSQGAVRLEKTSDYFLEKEYPAVADPEVLLALAAACRRQHWPFHVGITATAPGFYGPQGREIPGFPVRDPDLPKRLMRQGVLNFEMETSALFLLAKLRRARAGAVCVAYASRPRHRFISPKLKNRAEQACLQVGLSACLLLSRMDRRRGGDPLWIPNELLKK